MTDRLYLVRRMPVFDVAPDFRATPDHYLLVSLEEDCGSFALSHTVRLALLGMLLVGHEVPITDDSDGSK